MRSSERILISDVLKTKLGSFHCLNTAIDPSPPSFEKFSPTFPSSFPLKIYLSIQWIIIQIDPHRNYSNSSRQVYLFRQIESRASIRCILAAKLKILPDSRTINKSIINYFNRNNFSSFSHLSPLRNTVDLFRNVFHDWTTNITSAQI